MDFLGLANLTILAKARDIIRESRGIDLDLYGLPMDDKKTFDLLSSGETTGVFQLESAGMRRYIKELKPTCFSDIAAMVALYRPGPMEHIPKFIRSKHGLEPISYPHPALEKILEETYGVIVYQDQVLFIVREFAGYSLGQADIFRKAMGKKKPEVIQKEKVNFINGAKKLGYSEEIANTIFALIEPFAGYAFNKAHSVSYALIAYQTAYLKANYPSEYMTAFLMVNSDDLEKMGNAIAECRRLGITVRPPSVNYSQINFSLEDSGDKEKPAIRFGLSAIKNVGAGAIEPLVAERNKTIEDFCRRIDTQTGVGGCWRADRAGAMDCLETRGSDEYYQQAEQKLRNSGQTTMFDLFGQASPAALPGLELSGGEVSAKEKLAWEKELMGVYLSEHPFGRYSKYINSEEIILPSQVNAELEGQNITLVGMVDSVRELFTRDHKPFCSCMLGDDVASLEVMVWPRNYETSKELWKEGNFLMIQGKVKAKDERLQFVCDTVDIFKPDTETRTSSLMSTGNTSAEITSNGNANRISGDNVKVNGIKPINGKQDIVSGELHRLTLVLYETDEEKDEAVSPDNRNS